MTSVEREARRAFVAQAVRRMEAAGVNWSAWARERGFSINAVRQVRRGEAVCLRGDAYRIAAALGVVEPGCVDRLEGPVISEFLADDVEVISERLPNAADTAQARCEWAWRQLDRYHSLPFSERGAYVAALVACMAAMAKGPVLARAGIQTLFRLAGGGR